MHGVDPPCGRTERPLSPHQPDKQAIVDIAKRQLWHQQRRSGVETDSGWFAWATVWPFLQGLRRYGEPPQTQTAVAESWRLVDEFAEGHEIPLKPVTFIRLSVLAGTTASLRAVFPHIMPEVSGTHLLSVGPKSVLACYIILHRLNNWTTQQAIDGLVIENEAELSRYRHAAAHGGYQL